MTRDEQKLFIDKTKEFMQFFRDYSINTWRSLSFEDEDLLEILLERSIESVQGYNFELNERAKQLRANKGNVQCNT